jgi:hypothetical protein
MDMNLMTLNMQIGSKVTWHLIGVYKENVSKDRYSQAIAQRRQIRPSILPSLATITIRPVGIKPLCQRMISLSNPVIGQKYEYLTSK